MGEIQQQNEALNPRMILGILKEAEGDWSESHKSHLKAELEEFTCALLISFGAALWGEEISLVSLKGMLSTWLECTTALPHPHIMVTLHGRFKGETGLRWHCLPLSIQNASGLPYKLWIARLLCQKLLEEGRQNG
jgi:hypothetical protein